MYYTRVNSVLYDFRPCHVNAKLLSTYGLDRYGSQLWNYYNNGIDVQFFFVERHKSIRRL